MQSEIGILAATAASIGFIHTLTGPDHYLPFIVLGRARNWTLTRTLLVTAVCGVGHVLGSVILGLVGIGLGVAVSKLEFIEGVRGDLAAWLLISFGLVYFIWGLRRAWRNKPHTHPHWHTDGTQHIHNHQHHQEHAHVHEAPAARAHEVRPWRSLTPWALFVVFVLGPCEPLIPILMYPAAHNSLGGLVLVTSIFAATTLATMMVMVTLARRGLQMISLQKMERYTHAIAGGTICASGLAIRFLGL